MPGHYTSGGLAQFGAEGHLCSVFGVFHFTSLKYSYYSAQQSCSMFFFELVGKIECWAWVGFPDPCPAFDFAAVFGGG